MSVTQRLKNVQRPQSSSFASRFGLEELKQRHAKRGKRVFELYGADVLEWGHDNEHLSQVMLESEKAGYGGHYAQHTNVVKEFKNAVADFQKNVRKVDSAPEDIVPVAGIANGWSIIHFCLLDPGSEMLGIGPAHYFWGPSSYLGYYQAEAVCSKSDGDWEPDLDDLRSKLNPRTKAIVLDHPNNPTGTIYSEKALKGIINIAGEHDIPVISDEIYDLVVFDGLENVGSLASKAGDVPVITMYSTSKFLMKPGWRLGYMCFHDPEGKITEFKKTVDMVANTYGHGTASVSTLVMAAGVRAFKGPFGEGKKMMKKIQRSRDYTFKRLNEIEGLSCTKSRATMYAFPRVNEIGRKWKDDEEFVAEMMKREGVLFVPGSFFGDVGRGHFRTLLLPSVEILQLVYDRLENFMKST